MVFNGAIVLQHVLDIGCFTSNVHVVASDGLDKRRERPHADAPRVAPVGLSHHLVGPVHVLLAGDSPEVFLTPKKRFAHLFVHKLGANPMIAVMITLEVAIARALPRTDLKIGSTKLG